MSFYQISKALAILDHLNPIWGNETFQKCQLQSLEGADLQMFIFTARFQHFWISNPSVQSYFAITLGLDWPCTSICISASLLETITRFFNLSAM